MGKKRTNEEMSQIVNDYMAKYPHTNRKKIIMACDVNNARLNKLEQLGLIKLPPKIKPGWNSQIWKEFKL
jgi:hypothetical protein